MPTDLLDTVLQAATTLDDPGKMRATTPRSDDGATTPIAPAYIDRTPLSSFFTSNVENYEVEVTNGVRAVYLKGKRQLGPMISQMRLDDVVKLFPGCTPAEISSIFRRLRRPA